VYSEKGDTSEDFWTVGNATRWMVLFSRLLGIKGDGDVLEGMKAGEPLLKKGEEGGNVWELVMGKDLVEGEAEVK
jgi:hypothetical protein